MVLSSGIVGLAVFTGVLLYGPQPPARTREAATGVAARGHVRSDVIDDIRRGNDERAIERLEAHLSEDPDFGWGWRVLHQVASRDERHGVERDYARQRLLSLSRRDWRDDDWRWDGRTEVLIAVLAGVPRRASDAADEMIEGLADLDGYMNGATRWYLSGAALSVAGRTEEAIAALERAVQEGYDEGRWLRRSPDLDPLRGEARFEELVQRVRDANRRAHEEPGPDAVSGREPGETPQGGDAPGGPAGAGDG